MEMQSIKGWHPDNYDQCDAEDERHSYVSHEHYLSPFRELREKMEWLKGFKTCRLTPLTGSSRKLLLAGSISLALYRMYM